MDYRISALERQNRELAEEKRQLKERIGDYDNQLENKDQALRGQAAGLSADLVRLGEEVQALRGRVEETEHAVKQKEG